MIEKIRAITPKDLAKTAIKLADWNKEFNKSSVSEGERWNTFLKALPPALKEVFLLMNKVDDAIKDKIPLKNVNGKVIGNFPGAAEIQEAWSDEIRASGVTFGDGDLDAVMTKLHYLHEEIFHQYTFIQGKLSQSLTLANRLKFDLSSTLETNKMFELKPSREQQDELNRVDKRMKEIDLYVNNNKYDISFIEIKLKDKIIDSLLEKARKQESKKNLL